MIAAMVAPLGRRSGSSSRGRFEFARRACPDGAMARLRAGLIPTLAHPSSNGREWHVVAANVFAKLGNRLSLMCEHNCSLGEGVSAFAWEHQTPRRTWSLRSAGVLSK
jgi:hypothetical protein